MQIKMNDPNLAISETKTYEFNKYGKETPMGGFKSTKTEKIMRFLFAVGVVLFVIGYYSTNKNYKVAYNDVVATTSNDFEITDTCDFDDEIDYYDDAIIIEYITESKNYQTMYFYHQNLIINQELQNDNTSSICNNQERIPSWQVNDNFNPYYVAGLSSIGISVTIFIYIITSRKINTNKAR